MAVTLPCRNNRSPMRLLVFRSLWTNGFNLETAIADCRTGLFDGVEGPAPDDKDGRIAFARILRESGLPFIAEVVTGGGYVPDRNASPDAHLDQLRRKLDAALECSPLFVTVLAGCDAWPMDMCVDFYGKATECAAERNLIASFETHRSRPTFNPWSTRDLLRQLPALRLTCDFSHWCCVTERLALDTEPEILALCAARAMHIHARVGYAQGPQVPHPAAPEYRTELNAHERWWRSICDTQARTGREFFTMTPEFGPDGYLHCAPFTQLAAADLDEVNHWMAARLRNFSNALAESCNRPGFCESAV
jgi:hypothetical protein